MNEEWESLDAMAHEEIDAESQTRLQLANLDMMNEIGELKKIVEDCMNRLQQFDENRMTREEREKHAAFIAQLRSLID